jgi:hypothetical protein
MLSGGRCAIPGSLLVLRAGGVGALAVCAQGLGPAGDLRGELELGPVQGALIPGLRLAGGGGAMVLPGSQALGAWGWAEGSVALVVPGRAVSPYFAVSAGPAWAWVEREQDDDPRGPFWTDRGLGATGALQLGLREDEGWSIAVALELRAMGPGDLGTMGVAVTMGGPGSW